MYIMIRSTSRHRAALRNLIALAHDIREGGPPTSHFPIAIQIETVKRDMSHRLQNRETCHTNEPQDAHSESSNTYFLVHLSSPLPVSALGLGLLGLSLLLGSQPPPPNSAFLGCKRLSSF